MSKNETIYGLACAGGGAHGAYQVGVLKYIHEKFADGNQSPFRIFTGSSCGALNTSFYATQSHDAKTARLLLEELWMGFHVPQYHGPFLRNALTSILRKKKGTKRPSWSLLDQKPLFDIVEKGFKRSDLSRAFQEKTTWGIAIAATELISGQTCWFLEGERARSWNLFHSVGILDQLNGIHLAASCSVPVFLPPVKIGNRFFLDGSVSLDRPLSAAISMGATRILSIASQKPSSPGLPVYDPDYQPRLSDVIGMLLNRLSRDASSDESIEIQMLNRFYRSLPRKRRQRGESGAPPPLFHEEALPSHYQPVEICLFYPSKRIRQSTGITQDDEFVGKKRRKSTRFMFHEKFIGELIKLGYSDARTNHAELKRFFTPKKTSPWWFPFPRK